MFYLDLRQVRNTVCAVRSSMNLFVNLATYLVNKLQFSKHSLTEVKVKNWKVKTLNFSGKSLKINKFTKQSKTENSEFFREKSKNKQIHQKLKTMNFSGKSPKINKFIKNWKTQNSEFFREKCKNKQIHQKLETQGF